MQHTKWMTVSLSVIAASLAFGSLAYADHERYMGGKQRSANEIIGTKVVNAQNEDLGKVQDIIVDLNSGQAPYAIIGSGFAGRTKVAIPLSSLQCSSDGKYFTLAATKEDLKAASKTSPERWGIAGNAEWTNKVDGYYGERSLAFRERGNRQRLDESGDTRVFTRDPAPKGAERLMQPSDRALCEKVCETIDNIQVDIDNGVAHLYGQVESATARQILESKVRAVQGVQRVESHLKVKNQ